MDEARKAMAEIVNAEEIQRLNEEARQSWEVFQRYAMKDGTSYREDYVRSMLEALDCVFESEVQRSPIRRGRDPVFEVEIAAAFVEGLEAAGWDGPAWELASICDCFKFLFSGELGSVVEFMENAHDVYEIAKRGDAVVNGVHVGVYRKGDRWYPAVWVGAMAYSTPWGACLYDNRIIGFQSGNIYND